MSPKRSALSNRQKELASRFDVVGLRATFAPDTIIPDWPVVKKVFQAFGATWVRGPRNGKGHFAFPNASSLQGFEEARATGDYVDPRANDFFPTPQWLAQKLVAKAAIQPAERVLEPSAGRGAIAEQIRAAAPASILHCCELLPDNQAHLASRGFELVGSDFLAYGPAEPYDVIVMNPPFGSDYGRSHVLRALRMLQPFGTLVAIMGAGVTFREDRASSSFRDFVRSLGGIIVPNPDDAFTQSGTNCRTVTLEIPGARLEC